MLGEVSNFVGLKGTVAELGGGKFANGAVTGAFAMLFNHSLSPMAVQRMKIKHNKRGTC